MVLSILRGLFIVLVAAVAALYLLSNQWHANVDFGRFVLTLLGAMAAAAGVVALDVAMRRKRLSALSGVFLGLIAGLVAAYALSFVVDLIYLYTEPASAPAAEAYRNILQGVKVFIGLITCYLGISLVIQTKDDFRFVIPYVEFAKEVRGNRPTILDTSVIVDGRVLDIIETNIMQGTVVVPKFVLEELQTIADSSDKLRRMRGRRGLEILQKLQNNQVVDVHIEEAAEEGHNVDQQIIALAQRMQGRVMTNDYNLNKVATLRGVDVINLNDLAKALRPVVLPGEHMTVRLVKPGESDSQGVGYLEDGTMVVVEEGRSHLSEEVQLVVTSTLQTSAGRMIFGRFEGRADSGASRSGGGAGDDDEAGAQPAAVGGPSRANGSNDPPHSRPERGPSRRNPRRR